MDAQGWIGVAGLVSGLAALLIHRIGHVNHRIAIDDINDYLKTMHGELTQQGVKLPPPPIKEG